MSKANWRSKLLLKKIILKKILLLSDTHSHIDDTILKYVAQADEVWHAGDIGDLAVTDSDQKAKTVALCLWEY